MQSVLPTDRNITRDDLKGLEYTHNMVMTINQICWEKCVSKIGESEITTGEGSCGDRCVAKYFTLLQLIRERTNPSVIAPGQ